MPEAKKPEQTAVTLSDVEMQLDAEKKVQADYAEIDTVAKAVVEDLETIALAVRVADLRALGRVPKKRAIADDVLLEVMKVALPEKEALKPVLLENLERVGSFPSPPDQGRSEKITSAVKAHEKALGNLANSEDSPGSLMPEAVFYFALLIVANIIR